MARAGHRRRGQQARLESDAGPGGEEVRAVQLIAPKNAAPVAGTAPFSWEAAATRGRLPTRGLPQQRHDLLHQPTVVLSVDTKTGLVRRDERTFPRPRRPTCGGSARLDASNQARSLVRRPHVPAWCRVQSSSPAPAIRERTSARQRSRPVTGKPVGSRREVRGRRATRRRRPLLPSAITTAGDVVRHHHDTRRRCLTSGGSLAYDASNIDSTKALASSAWRPFKIDGTRPTVTRKSPVTSTTQDRELHGDVQRAGHGSSRRQRCGCTWRGAARPFRAKVTISANKRRGNAQPEREPGARQDLHDEAARGASRTVPGNALVATRRGGSTGSGPSGQ